MGHQAVHQLSIWNDVMATSNHVLCLEAVRNGRPEQLNDSVRCSAVDLRGQVFPLGNGLHEDPGYHARQSWILSGKLSWLFLSEL